MAWGVPKIGAVAEVASGNLTLAEPAGIAQGDLMVACIAIRSTVGFANADWTKVESQLTGNTISTGAGIASGEMWVCRRGASAPSLVFTRTGGDLGRGCIIAYSGAKGTLVTDTLDTHSSNTLASASLTATTASITTTEAGELIVAMNAAGDNYTVSAFAAATDPATASGATDTTSPPTNGTWEERVDGGTNTGADGGLAIGDAVRATAGATGTVQCTVSGSARHVMIVAAFKMQPVTTSTVAATQGGHTAAATGTHTAPAAVTSTAAATQGGHQAAATAATAVSFASIRQNIINGLDSAQAEAAGWDAVVKAGLAVTAVVRTSDTVVTITLPAFLTYNITAQETITVTVPAAALASGGPLTAAPTIAVTVTTNITGTVGATETGHTAAATGLVAITSTAAATQGGHTAAASGTVTAAPAITSTVAGTQTGHAASASGTVTAAPAVTSTVGATQGGHTAAATGTVAAAGVTSTVGATQGGHTAAATGSVTVLTVTLTLKEGATTRATRTFTLTAVDTALTGYDFILSPEEKAAVTDWSALTLDIAADGPGTLKISNLALVTPNNAIVDATQGGHTAAGTGTVTAAPAITSTLAATQGGHTAAGTGTVTAAPATTSTVAATQTGHTAAATGTVTAAPAATSTVAATQTGHQAAATGTVTTAGTTTSTVAATQTGHAAAATGTVTAAPARTSTIAATGAVEVAAATGSVGFTGTAAATEGSHVAAGAGTVTGPPARTSTVAGTQAGHVGAATGIVAAAGATVAAVSATQGTHAAAGSGTVTAPPARTSTVAATQGAHTASGSGTVTGPLAITAAVAASETPHVAGASVTVPIEDRILSGAWVRTRHVVVGSLRSPAVLPGIEPGTGVGVPAVEGEPEVVDGGLGDPVVTVPEWVASALGTPATPAEGNSGGPTLGLPSATL